MRLQIKMVQNSAQITEEEFKEGQVLLIDKPLTWTSFQVVNKIRWEIRQRFGLKKIKVGHAGTLDPLATGLLIICTGKQTKQIHRYQAQQKEYTGVFTLGATTPSYDLETDIGKVFPTAHISKELLYKTASQFIGDIEQKPPIFSAIKKEGKRLYELARARIVSISEFEITQINLPQVAFRIVCSKGTYIRSLAYDFGLALGSGAHLSALIRTKIGNFSVEKGLTTEQFIKNLNTHSEE